MFVLFFKKNTRSSADLEHKKIACLKLVIKTFYKKKQTTLHLHFTEVLMGIGLSFFLYTIKVGAVI